MELKKHQMQYRSNPNIRKLTAGSNFNTTPTKRIFSTTFKNIENTAMRVRSTKVWPLTKLRHNSLTHASKAWINMGLRWNRRPSSDHFFVVKLKMKCSKIASYVVHYELFFLNFMKYGSFHFLFAIPFLLLRYSDFNGIWIQWHHYISKSNQ